MKSLCFAVAALLLPASGLAGEASLQTTYQPLIKIGQDGIRIAEVTCVDWSSHSGFSTQIGLISAKNVPPTNNKEATKDLNIASRCRLIFRTGDPQVENSVTLDATKFQSDEYFDRDEENGKELILRATLECLRRVLPEQLKKVKVGLLANETDKAWITPILDQFNSADRSKPFFDEKNR